MTVSNNSFGSDIGVIWGQSHLYSLTAPKGWVLDNKSGKKNNLHATGTHIKKMEDIDAIFKVNNVGIATRAFWFKNDTAECFMQNGILGWAFPKPPINNFHYHIAIKMKTESRSLRWIRGVIRRIKALFH